MNAKISMGEGKQYLGGKYVPPSFKSNGFHCPHCGVWAHQVWFDVAIGNAPKTFKKFVEGLFISFCQRCVNYAVWHGDKMIYPICSIVPWAVEDMPEEVKADFIEARSIINISPRGAAALLRLALQELMPHVGEKGKDLNTDIANLVSRGLPEKIQKALDAVRVIGNNAVHPGEIDLKDDTEIALTLFELLNMIVEVMIMQPKRVDVMYDKIPGLKKEAVRKRNQEHK